jgi:hypothetical protein
MRDMSCSSFAESLDRRAAAFTLVGFWARFFVRSFAAPYASAPSLSRGVKSGKIGCIGARVCRFSTAGHDTANRAAYVVVVALPSVDCRFAAVSPTQGSGVPRPHLLRQPTCEP